MEAIIISKNDYQEILEKINLIHKRVETITSGTQDTFIDNCEFIQRMKISKRTAQTWRDEKRIAYSQIGAKIYYKLADVENLLNRSVIQSRDKVAK